MIDLVTVNYSAVYNVLLNIKNRLAVCCIYEINVSILCRIPYLSLYGRKFVIIYSWHYFNFSAPGGDFQSILDDDQVPFEQDVQRYLRQIGEGLQFMHQLNIAHLDIKVISKTFLINAFYEIKRQL